MALHELPGRLSRGEVLPAEWLETAVGNAGDEKQGVIRQWRSPCVGERGKARADKGGASLLRPRTTKPWRQTPDAASLTSWMCRSGTPSWTDRAMAAPSRDPSSLNPPSRMVGVSPPSSQPSAWPSEADAGRFPRSHSRSGRRWLRSRS